jgi:hypothetical protein
MKQLAALTPLRSRTRPRSLEDWCVFYAERWQIPEEHLITGMHGPEIILFPPKFQARIEHLHEIARLLNELMPPEMQWNFWFRPTLAEPTPPACRMGWDGSPERLALQLIAELQALLEQVAAIAPSDSEQHPWLRLFLPVTMYKFVDWTSGSITTRYEIDADVRPARHTPLEFRAGDFAKHRRNPPWRAVPAVKN